MMMVYLSGSLKLEMENPPRICQPQKSGFSCYFGNSSELGTFVLFTHNSNHLFMISTKGTFNLRINA